MELNGSAAVEGLLTGRIPSDLHKYQHDFARDILALTFWLSPESVATMPILLPHVVRDPACRTKRANSPKGPDKDLWGCANEDGFFRDDNSRVKDIKNKGVVSSPYSHFDGQKLGGGFVACHLWGGDAMNGGSTTRQNWLNTFAPNLVWMPDGYEGFTEGGCFFQEYFQAISCKLYKDLWEHDFTRAVGIPQSLPCPDPSIIGLVSEEELARVNLIDIDTAGYRQELAEVLHVLDKGQSSQIRSKIYYDTLGSVGAVRKRELAEALKGYAKAYRLLR
jgi:hypothetical protein